MVQQIDIAKRVYDHTWRLDPILRSLLDTDFYKLLMLQMIWGLYPDVQATFSLTNRTKAVRLADEVDEKELRDQLDHARTLRFSKKEMIWLAGNSFYGRSQIFSPEFLTWLRDFQLPAYELHKEDGQFVLEFPGPWMYTSMWEIPALAILSELRSRSALKRNFGRFTLDVIYARAKAKLWSKVERLARLPGLRISDFGTRRRHSFIWQRWCVEALKEGLGDAFIGTPTCCSPWTATWKPSAPTPMSCRWSMPPSPRTMTTCWPRPTACCATGSAITAATCWSCFRTPSARRRFCAARPTGWPNGKASGPDSAPPIEGGERIVEWWRQRGQDPREKLLVFSDALDADTHRGDLSSLRKKGAHEFWLGNQPHQRFRRLRAQAQ